MTVEGFSSLSLVTDSDQLFEQTAQFYLKLNFRIVKSYNKNVNFQLSTALEGISNDSTRELWLESFALQDLDANNNLVPLQELRIYSGDGCEQYNESTLLKLRLSHVPVVASAKFIYVFTTNLDRVKQVLGYSGAESEFSVEDPLGNSLFITSKQSFMSSREFQDHQEYIRSRQAELLAGSKPLAELVKDAQPVKKRIGVMTSGGDAPGMNPAVRAVVRAALHYGCEAYAIYEGYEGLVQDIIKKMEWEDVRSLLSQGGTVIGTARCMKFKERDGRLLAAKHMIKNGIDGLIVIGGDGSLTGADLFRSEWPSLVDELVSNGTYTDEQVKPYRHLTIVGLVGSIDNDMATTDATIGAYSALERITEMVDHIDATATSHSRAFVVEVMGRHCGWLGLLSGLSTGADFIFIPERPPKASQWKDDLKAVCTRHRTYGKRNTTVIVAEGAIDDELNPITSEDIKEVLVELGLDTRITILGHVQRGGTAVAYDRMLATLQGVEAVKAVLESTPDTDSPMIGIRGNKLVRQPLMKAVEVTKSVAKAIEAKDFDKAMSLRDSHFEQAYKQYLYTSIYDDQTQVLPKEQQLNIGIVHIGASSSGLNAATRAIALYCLARGHKPYAIQNGFSGLINEGLVQELSWLDVESWHNKGGSEIGTNRSLPSEDYGKVAYYLQKYNLNGLIIIGGFESFTALHQLDEQKKSYPIFNIPMIVIPATVSNNVPGTEYSLGSDTCLNQLVAYCDAVKQSASSSRRRVFVVEVQGGHSGFVASYIGLVTGAIAVYTPENKMNLKTLQEDVELIFDIFSGDRGEDRNGKMIIRNEQASGVYTTELISEILRENGKNRFETRTAIPGHVQQGFTPTSQDRVYAVGFGIRAVEFIEQNQEIEDYTEQSGNHVVIGLVGSKIECNDIGELYYNEADIKLRKGTRIHWNHMVKINDVLSGRIKLRTK